MSFIINPDYSEKGFSVHGTVTKDHRKQLREMGGAWNTSRQCWFFSKKRLREVEAYMKMIPKMRSGIIKASLTIDTLKHDPLVTIVESPLPPRAPPSSPVSSSPIESECPSPEPISPIPVFKKRRREVSDDDLDTSSPSLPIPGFWDGMFGRGLILGSQLVIVCIVFKIMKSQ